MTLIDSAVLNGNPFSKFATKMQHSLRADNKKVNPSIFAAGICAPDGYAIPAE
jgi:hypothetical protein